MTVNPQERKRKDRVVATRLDEDLYQRLVSRAENECRKVSDQIRFAVIQNLDTDPQEDAGAVAVK